MENVENLNVEQVEERFSVLYLSLRTTGVQKYLRIDILADPKAAARPIPKSHLKNLKNFARWLFGDKDNVPVVRDSRQIDNFGRILESTEAVRYLERTSSQALRLRLTLPAVTNRKSWKTSSRRPINCSWLLREHTSTAGLLSLGKPSPLL